MACAFALLSVAISDVVKKKNRAEPASRAGQFAIEERTPASGLRDKTKAEGPTI